MSAYTIPRERIVYEVLNSEVIVVDFSTGNYYALIHIAKLVWQIIEQKATLETIAQYLSEQKMCIEAGKNRDAILADLKSFFRELLENQLIEPISDGVSLEIILPIPDGWKYDPPRLQKYTDVQSLLLLDPVHEVSEFGWPMKL